MRIYNPQNYKSLERYLYDALFFLRAKRGFDAKKYTKAKSQLFNQYISRFKLSACVVAVSGGIDSAVTLGIIKYASTLKHSPIKRIIPVLLPVFAKEGATNQEEALSRGKEICRFFGVELVIADLTYTHHLLKNVVDSSIGTTGKAWASGQLVSYIRTPALYYTSSLLAQGNLPAIVCGTTNRDEGAYLGYFGKASDGMVDVQIISDIHKSEVYQVAQILKIPQSIIKAVPTGDMFDGRSDEEVFGAPYDFVELFLLMKSLKDKEMVESIKQKWTIKARRQFKILSKRIEKLHKYNQHKYIGGSVSIHLDVYERMVPGGWRK